MTTLEAISLLLRKNNLYQRDLTDYLGKKKSIFTDWINSKSESYKKYLPQIAEFLKVDIKVLLDPDKYILVSPTNEIEVVINKDKIDIKQTYTPEEYEHLFLKFSLLNEEQQKLVYKFIDMLLNEEK